MDKYNYCHIAEKTDVGCKRQQNEDWLTHFDCENGRISVVCDGMGGHVGGREASHTAIDAIRQFCTTNCFDDPRALIVAAIDYANRQILAKTAQRPELSGMGSTCVMLVIRDGMVYIGSVGDSRIYIIRDKTIRQLTKDQSYVQMLVDSGNLTPEEAEHHPRKNEILNALGIPDMKPATVLPDAISPVAGDCFLLCSDGLSGMVSDNKILNIVSQQSSMSSQERVDMLIEEARKNGGLDNITAQIVEFSISPSIAAQSERTLTGKNPKRIIFLVVVLTLLLASVVVAAIKFFPKVNSDEETVTREIVDKGCQTITISDTVRFVSEKGEIRYTVNGMKQTISIGEFSLDSLNIEPKVFGINGNAYVFNQVDEFMVTIGTDSVVYKIKLNVVQNEQVAEKGATDAIGVLETVTTETGSAVSNKDKSKGNKSAESQAGKDTSGEGESAESQAGKDTSGEDESAESQAGKDTSGEGESAESQAGKDKTQAKPQQSETP